MEKGGKICLWSIIAFIIIYFGLTFGGMLLDYWTDETHMVKIDWTIYTNSGPVHKSGTYEMKGDSFVGSTHSYRGTNTVTVKDEHNWYAYYGKQTVCIYVGTNDVDINSIKIVK